MLMLSRKCNQSVLIGGNDRCERLVKVTVLEIDGNKVQLGFDVDADVPVHRFEVWEQIHAGPKSGLKPESTTMPLGC